MTNSNRRHARLFKIKSRDLPQVIVANVYPKGGNHPGKFFMHSEHSFLSDALKTTCLRLLYLGSFIFAPEGIQLIIESAFQHYNSPVSNANLESLT